MDALFLNGLVTNRNKQTVPSWMRDERCMYCEPAVHKKESFWKALLHLFV